MAVLLLAKALALVLCLQFGGMTHGLGDLALALDVGAAEHDDHCPVNGSCDDCPPGCPTCHCPAAMRSLPAQAALEMALEPRIGAESRYAFDRTQAPPGPEIPGIFRPPRAGARA